MLYLEMDVCGMEFEDMLKDQWILEYEANKLVRITECVDHVKEFVTKLHDLCNTLNFVTEHLCQMYTLMVTRKRNPNMQELSVRC